jgi:hypothetical protein
MAVGWSANARRCPQRGEDEHRATPAYRSEWVSATDPDETSLSFCAARPGQRLGPNARGGAMRGLGGCWSNGLVVVRLVAGMAGAAGSCCPQRGLALADQPTAIETTNRSGNTGHARHTSSIRTDQDQLPERGPQLLGLSPARARPFQLGVRLDRSSGCRTSAAADRADLPAPGMLAVLLTVR